jgi:hypothetical protein
LYIRQQPFVVYATKTCSCHEPVALHIIKPVGVKLAPDYAP